MATTEKEMTEKQLTILIQAFGLFEIVSYIIGQCLITKTDSEQLNDRFKQHIKPLFIVLEAENSD